MRIRTMGALALLAAGAMGLAACPGAVSDEARQAGEANRAALDACFQAAGFTTGQTSPAPADGGNRRGPGGDAWNDGSLQAADGTWLDLYHWSEWADDPNHAREAAAYQVGVFNEQAYAGYGPARAVGSRAYVPVGTSAAYENADLDACLAMP